MDQIQVGLGTVIKLVLVFFLLLVAVIILGYLAFFKPRVVERDRLLVETNYVIREKLKVLTNERRELEAVGRRSDEIIRLAGVITDASSPQSAIALFQSLQSNK